MATGKADCLSLEFWTQFMGRDLPNAGCQPLQPVMIEEGQVKLDADTLKAHFAPGTKVGLGLHEGRVQIRREDAAVLLDGRLGVNPRHQLGLERLPHLLQQPRKLYQTVGDVTETLLQRCEVARDEAVDRAAAEARVGQRVPPPLA